jgi:hypothetical protein
MKKADDGRMRIMHIITLGSLLLLAPTVQAKNRGHKKAEAKVAVIDDQDATQKPPVDEIKTQTLGTRGTDDAQLRAGSDVATPAAVGVQTGLPDAVMHQPAPAPEAPLPPASLTDGAILELAAKQMRHERRTLDACAADAQARNPSAKGSVTLRLTIEDRKVVNVAVDQDSLHDAQLTSCLVNAGHALKFTLKQASFYWPVSL